jgi:acetolactate synthase-1/2/3 large subunit
MNGAQSLIHTLVNCGVRLCFANPGTSEMHFVAALDSVPEMRAVLCLFEGVATGAADGYARVSGSPALTLLHLGPGLANGLANLHNARRAGSPIINVVGEHATFHRQYEAPLTADIVGIARPVSSWICESRRALSVAADAARAVQAARAAPGGVATLILSADAAWNPAERPADKLPDIGAATVNAAAIDNAAKLLRNGRKTVLLLRGAALRGAGLEAAGRVQAATGARLCCDTFAPTTELGAGRVPVERLPYLVEQAIECLAGVEQILLVGTIPPVAFFGYPGKPSRCAPEDCQFSYLAHPHEDGAGALSALADLLGAPARSPLRVPLLLPDIPSGSLDVAGVTAIMAATTPEGAILVDEAITSGPPLLQAMATARPHMHLAVAGGSLGQGMPAAVGAALAAPDRKVVCALGDGSAAYIPQALWTMARENLDVTTVIFANRAYAILNFELQRAGASALGVGPKALSMFDLGRPQIDWVNIAQGLGVEASRATTCAEFADQYRSAMQQRAPRLIEAII